MMRTRYWLGIACAGVLLAVGAHFVPTGESEEEQVERQRAEIERPTADQQAELAGA